jgi:plastocyanin
MFAKAHRAFSAALWVSLAVVCAADGTAPPGESGKTHVVTINEMRFSEATLTVRKGDRVTWVNKDLYPHTATANDGTFDSGNIAAEASWTYTASKPGEYAYICTYHPTMKAKLIVQ